MIILSLDLGTKLGVAVYKDSRKIESSCLHLKDKDIGRRLNHFRRYLVEVKGRLGRIDKVYFELVCGRSSGGFKAMNLYGALWGVVLSFCDHHGIEAVGVAVPTIKKFITGNGRADKLAVIAAVQEKGIKLNSRKALQDNEADALALLLYAVENERNKADD